MCEAGRDIKRKDGGKVLTQPVTTVTACENVLGSICDLDKG